MYIISSCRTSTGYNRIQQYSHMYSKYYMTEQKHVTITKAKNTKSSEVELKWWFICQQLIH